MRHGEAEAPRADDASRELVPAGVADVATVARNFSSRFPSPPDVLAVSPYERTQQTATVVQQYLAPGQVETWQEIVPTTAVAPVIEKLEGYADIMLITHQPLVSLLAEWLVGETVPIRPSTLLVITTEILKPEWGEVECVITA